MAPDVVVHAGLAQAVGSITVAGTEEWYETSGVRMVKRQAPVGFPMAHRDWNRFGHYLKDLGEALPPIHDRYVRFEGMAVGGGIGFVGWLIVVGTGAPMNLLLGATGLVLLAGTLAAAGIAWSNRSTELF